MKSTSVTIHRKNRLCSMVPISGSESVNRTSTNRHLMGILYEQDMHKVLSASIVSLQQALMMIIVNGNQTQNKKRKIPHACSSTTYTTIFQKLQVGSQTRFDLVYQPIQTHIMLNKKSMHGTLILINVVVAHSHMNGTSSRTA